MKRYLTILLLLKKADGELVKLTATELKIVDLLMRNPGRVFPAKEIYQTPILSLFCIAEKAITAAISVI